MHLLRGVGQQLAYVDSWNTGGNGSAGAARTAPWFRIPTFYLTQAPVEVEDDDPHVFLLCLFRRGASRYQTEGARHSSTGNGAKELSASLKMFR